jgi:hypothetical protein
MGAKYRFDFTDLHRLADYHIKHLQQISVKSAQILECGRELLIVRSGSGSGSHI